LLRKFSGKLSVATCVLCCRLLTENAKLENTGPKMIKGWQMQGRNRQQNLQKKAMLKIAVKFISETIRILVT